MSKPVIEEPPIPTIPYAEAALELVAQFRALLSSIPGFLIPPAPLERQSRPRGHRLLPDAFFEALAVALETSPMFAAAVSITAAEIRDMLRYSEAYLPLADELERFARGFRYAVAKRRGEVGMLAASAYKVAKAMNLLPDISLPVPEAESMKQAIVSRRRKTPLSKQNRAAADQPSK
ncbi:MAG TPA: hypothetical protein VEK57_21885 [Thermoanaerobaculia bacterium]|nr:hypothetical protein [Thermoanaerobaculia bacterium]